ncbi:MAG: hypothetical protein QM786_02835 [Breznakibacter sp.]
MRKFANALTGYQSGNQHQVTSIHAHCNPMAKNDFEKDVRAFPLKPSQNYDPQTGT